MWKDENQKHIGKPVESETSNIKVMGSIPMKCIFILFVYFNSEINYLIINKTQKARVLKATSWFPYARESRKFCYKYPELGLTVQEPIITTGKYLERFTRSRWESG